MKKKNSISIEMDSSQFQAKCDMSTLREAEEIKKDSKRMSAAKAEASKHIKLLESVAKTQKSNVKQRLEKAKL